MTLFPGAAASQVQRQGVDPRPSWLHLRQHALAESKEMQREPQIGNLKNIVGIEQEYRDLGRYIPVIFLLSSSGSLVGVPMSVPSERSWSTRIA